MNEGNFQPGPDLQRAHDDDVAGHRAPGTTRWSRWAVVIPAATLLLGFALGAIVMGAGGTSRPPAATVSVPSNQSAPSEAADQSAVVIPQACVRAAESLQRSTAVLRKGVASLRDFRGHELVDALNELEDLDAQARKQAEACTAVKVTTSSSEPTSNTEQDIDTASPDATATPSDEPSPSGAPSSAAGSRRSQ